MHRFRYCFVLLVWVGLMLLPGCATDMVVTQGVVAEQKKKEAEQAEQQKKEAEKRIEEMKKQMEERKEKLEENHP